MVFTKGFVRNRAGRVVVPSNFLPSLDLRTFDTLEQLDVVIRRDFDAKAPAEAAIVARAAAGEYQGRYELLRDIAAYLNWINRYVLTMYEPRPTRWRDVPRRRAGIFLATPSGDDRQATVAVIEEAYRRLPASWDEAAEHLVFGLLLDLFRHTAETEVRAVNPTVTEALAHGRLVRRLAAYDPDYPVYSLDDVVQYTHAVPALEALMRQTMVLHNAQAWDRERSAACPLAEVGEDDVVVVLHPRNEDVLEFLRRVGRPLPRVAATPVGVPTAVIPGQPVEVRRSFTTMPRLEALATQRGELVVTNEDLIRNSAYCWSPMTAEDILQKTGIRERLYTELGLDDLALGAAQLALARAGRQPDEVAAVIVCSCTSARPMPSIAARLAARLGIVQTHAAYDLMAACAALPYALGEAVRLLQELQRPILVVGAEKFSDKIGAVRASRMLFGDGAAAVVVGPAPAGARSDIEVFRTYASGPLGEVESIIWPNPDFDHGVTVHGPQVRALVQRYLGQMVREVEALPDPDGGPGSLLDAIDLVVPHQANQIMVTTLAREAGIPPERLYFNIGRVGNTSAASIGLALEDAVRDGVIDRPFRVFAPAFGAGAVAGYLVMRVDPEVVWPGATATASAEAALAATVGSS
jgi:3-oxoacyl-[acyl-carrier-protein] synthase III